MSGDNDPENQGLRDKGLRDFEEDHKEPLALSEEFMALNNSIYTLNQYMPINDMQRNEVNEANRLDMKPKTEMLRKYNSILSITAELNKNIDKIPPELQIYYKDIKLDPKICDDFNDLAEQLSRKLSMYKTELEEDIAEERHKEIRTYTEYLNDLLDWVKASMKVISNYIRRDANALKESQELRDGASYKARRYSKKRQELLQASHKGVRNNSLLLRSAKTPTPEVQQNSNRITR